MKIIVIGGTGTLGNAIMPLLLADTTIERIRVLSRGEHAQKDMERKFEGERIDYLLGDVADRERIEIACRGVGQIYHFAAIKHVDKAERDPSQAVKTNVIGTMNVINAAIRNYVGNCIYTSTDKAVDAINVYGQSKALAENLWIGGNMGAHISRFSAVRYGNVADSNGSVIGIWRKQIAKNEPLTITNPTMTRFFITKQRAAKFVYDSMNRMTGGEIFIPKMKAVAMSDLAEFIAPDHAFNVTGNRLGEKLDEDLISKNEVGTVYDNGDHFIKYPHDHLYPVYKKGEVFRNMQGYSSATAPRFNNKELEELYANSDR